MKRLALVLLLLAGCAASAVAQEAAGGKEPSLLWKWANFAILAAGLGYLAAKNLPSFFRSRTEAIQKGISEAQKMKRDAEQRAGEMEARMNALGADIEKFRTQARDEMEQEGERIRQEGARQIERLEQQTEQEVESATKAALRELRTFAAELALDLAEQRVKTQLDTSAETALVDGFVRDLQKQGSKN